VGEDDLDAVYPYYYQRREKGDALNKETYFYPYCRQAVGFCTADKFDEIECRKTNAHVICGHYHRYHPLSKEKPSMLGETNNELLDEEWLG
jgi:hypothetical protein